jgi:ribosome-associated translation inhibitor RaiA
MNLDVRRQGIEINEEVREHLKRRLTFNLGRFSQRVERVQVFLVEQNGPRGGIDKLCRILLRMRGLPDIVVEDRDADLLPLIDRTANRMGQVVRRELGRWLSRRQGQMTRR